MEKMVRFVAVRIDSAYRLFLLQAERAVCLFVVAIPFGVHGCSIIPSKSVLPNLSRSTTPPDYRFESRSLRVDIEGNSLAISVKNRSAIIEESYMVWEIKSYAIGPYQSVFVGFEPLQRTSNTEASAVAAFADGMKMVFRFSIPRAIGKFVLTFLLSAFFDGFCLQGSYQI
jgi:hypothetical protein